ncbi:MAG: hypothetical protein MI739_04155 [Bacteroidales bacterium]|nr:hypothetical protein [Bacteroidales bacterium]
MKSVKIFLLVCFSFSLNNLIAQDLNVLKEKEAIVKEYFAKLALEKNDKNKEKINKDILNEFRLALKQKESFYYKFSPLKNIGIINSNDKKVRIITWNLAFSNGTHKYFGFIQYKKSKRQIRTYELFDNSENIKNPEYAILGNANWYGALYYRIIVNKYKGKTYYTLLGADLNDLFTHKKIVEILHFDKKENVVFGDKVFKNRNKALTRIIFEFNAQAKMVLSYNKKMEMIVYDHLSPSDPRFVGQYEFYGPDFSYDGLKYEKGIWNTYKEIDVRNFAPH